LRSVALLVALVWLVHPGAPTAVKSASSAGTFVKVSPANGVDISIDGSGREDWGFGAAFFDYDGDGRLDLFVNAAKDQSGWLFKQDSDGSFHDVADTAGVADLANGRAAKCADYDNDGDIDVFVANLRGRNGTYAGPNRLYRNNGDGTFTDVAAQAHPALPSPNAPAFGAAWGDYNNDGWLDLYVVNRREVRNQLFRSNGDDGSGVTFTEVAADLGLDDEKAGLEAVWLDYDNDGDPDLYLSQDKKGGNRLWRNNGDGTFQDVSVETGSNVTIDSMGLAVGDYNNDGYLDIYITNIVDSGAPPDVSNILLRNQGDGTFENVAPQLGVKVDRYSWGTSFLDHDNDGDLDLFVVNWSAVGGNSQAENVFFRNNGNGTFSDATGEVGVGDSSPGFGVAVGDYNDDGYLDMFVVNNSGLGSGERVPFRSILYRNVPGNNRWLKVRTQGVASNRDGIGARVLTWAGSLRQIREKRSGESYLCSHSPELEFGFKNAQTVDSLVVLWPSGTVDILTDVATNQTLTIVEGSSAPLMISSVSATADPGGVDVFWEVSQETGFDGFRVYRTDTGSGEEVLLNAASLIDALTRTYRDTDVRPSREYAYVVAVVETGGGEVRSAPAATTTPGAALSLEQNYPNPFNPSTTIAFTLPERVAVTLVIHDSRGAQVRTLSAGDRDAGYHEVDWDGTNDRGQHVASGVYFYRLEASAGILTRKMVLVK